jgi:peptide deformylase
MSLIDIRTFPDPVLKEKTQPIQNIDGRLQLLIDDMAATMYAAPGIGLAANQVGVGQSLLIYDIAHRNEKRALHVLINPRILTSEGEIISEDEGCLSVPDFRADVKRAARVLVEGVDRDGNPVRLEGEGLLAIVLQHEIDHLNGTLFIERISALKRQIYTRRVLKQLKSQDI